MVCVAGVARQSCGSLGIKCRLDVTREGNSRPSWGDGFARELQCTQLHRHVMF